MGSLSSKVDADYFTLSSIACLPSVAGLYFYYVYITSQACIWPLAYLVLGKKM